MKKLFLIIGIILLIKNIIAQNINQAIPSLDRQILTEKEKTNNQKNSIKSESVIWSEDFGNGSPEGWEIVNLSETDSIAWEWTDQPIYGYYTPGEFPAEDLVSGSNGYMVVNLDGYNSVPQFTHGEGVVVAPNLAIADTYIELPTIDLSEYKGVFIEFYQLMRQFGIFNTIVMISNDYHSDNPEAAHWFSLHTQNLPQGWQVEEIKRMNISDFSAGYDSVTIRFYGYGATHYWWMLDDIRLIETPANNLVNEHQWLFYDWHEKAPYEAALGGYLQHGGTYTKIPKSQISTFVGAKMAVENYGYNNQGNVKLNANIYHKKRLTSIDSTLVYSAQTDAYNIQAWQQDTLFLSMNYKPTDWGYYDVYLNILMDSVDEYPNDNYGHFTFEVTDSTYSRTTDNINSTAATRHWLGGGFDGDRLAQYYHLTADVTEVKAFRFYFSEKNKDYLHLIEEGKYKAIAKIFGFNQVDDDWQTSAIIESDTLIMQVSDTGKFITLKFEGDGSTEYLPNGDYLIALETYTGVDDEAYFYIGEDIRVEQPDYTQFIWIENFWGWVYVSNFKFDLIIAAEDWDTTIMVDDKMPGTNNVILFQNYPNPANYITEIRYTLKENTNVRLQITDITGREMHIKNEGMQAAGLHTVLLDISNFDPGIYNYTLITENQRITKKISIIK